MMDAAVASTLVSSGPLGLIILYMMYLQREDRQTRKEERARRDEIDKDRIATDKELIRALAALTSKVDGIAK